jgi:NitT/TauT family transport system permease protein
MTAATPPSAHRWRRWLPALVTLTLLVVWELLAQLQLISRIFLPAPSRIFTFLGKSLVQGELLPVGATLGRMAAGFSLGTIPALLLGWAMGRLRPVRQFFDPFIAALHPIPKIAIFPLLMLVFGIGEASKVVAIAITSFFPVVVNTIAGTRTISPVYFEVASNYGASRWQTLWRVVIPGSLPMVLAGLRIALNTSLVVAVAVELLASRTGLGVLIWFAWQTLRVEQLYGTLFVTALIGISLNILIERVARWLAPWHRATTTREGA